MALRVCESATATGTDAAAGEGAREWLPVPLDTGPFAGILESEGHTCEWAVGRCLS
jgi:hypothetical protein